MEYNVICDTMQQDGIPGTNGSEIENRIMDIGYERVKKCTGTALCTKRTYKNIKIVYTEHTIIAQTQIYVVVRNNYILFVLSHDVMTVFDTLVLVYLIYNTIIYSIILLQRSDLFIRPFIFTNQNKLDKHIFINPTR